MCVCACVGLYVRVWVCMCVCVCVCVCVCLAREPNGGDSLPECQQGDVVLQAVEAAAESGNADEPTDVYGPAVPVAGIRL